MPSPPRRTHLPRSTPTANSLAGTRARGTLLKHKKSLDPRQHFADLPNIAHTAGLVVPVPISQPRTTNRGPNERISGYESIGHSWEGAPILSPTLLLWKTVSWPCVPETRQNPQGRRPNLLGIFRREPLAQRSVLPAKNVEEEGRSNRIGHKSPARGSKAHTYLSGNPPNNVTSIVYSRPSAKMALRVF